MPPTFTTYEAKARLSELLRRVRAGERIVITSHGEPVAELRPIEEKTETLDERFERLKREGRISEAVPGSTVLGIRPIAARPGGLKRFLESRD